MLRRLLAGVLTVLVLAGCARTVDGSPSAVSSRHAVDCPQHATSAVIACLRTSLSAFWSSRLGRHTDMRTVYAPTRSQVPRECRNGLELNTAFSCPIDNTVYLTAGFVRTTRSSGASQDGWIRLATTMAHEMGHIVQFDERAPLIMKRHNTLAESREVEQQADCLGGVWAGATGVDAQAFLAANRVVLQIVDNPHEVATHGTIAQRLAATDRGLTGRTVAACGLTLTR